MKLQRLQAGLATMQFDAETAFLRQLCFGNQEFIRGIFAAIRDRNWDTIPSMISNLKIDRQADSFRIEFEARCQRDEIDFQWTGKIIGTCDATIRYEFDGVAHSTFLKNRIGLCVLHPVLECAGIPCRVVDIDGRITKGQFPGRISPHQPFRNIASIAHEVVPSVVCTVKFEGETFEMEDQRNWTDASFKTYGTPLDLPFPVQLKPRDRIRHVITTSLHGSQQFPQSIHSQNETPRRLSINRESRRPLPPIGLMLGENDLQLAGQAFQNVTQLKPDHFRIDLQFSDLHWQERVKQAVELAIATGSKLEGAITVGENVQVELGNLVNELGPSVNVFSRWLIFSEDSPTTTNEHGKAAEKLLKGIAPEVSLCVGTNAYFAELNRNRPECPENSMICYSINPQVHAFDALSLVETLGAQPSTVESAVGFNHRRVVISPITLRPRFNPNATDSSESSSPESDPRQSSLFAASWTLGTLARLATHQDVAGLTFFEVTGSRGIMTQDGKPYPVFDVFEALMGWPNVVAAGSSHPLEFDGLALQNGDRHRLLLAVFFAKDLRISIDHDVNDATICRLGSDGWSPGETISAVNGSLPIEVSSAGVVMIDFTSASSSGGQTRRKTWAN